MVAVSGRTVGVDASVRVSWSDGSIENHNKVRMGGGGPHEQPFFSLVAA